MRMTEDEYAALMTRREGCGKNETPKLQAIQTEIPSEDWEQRMLAEYLDVLFRDGSVKWAHVPNGGARDKVTAAKLKGHGVKRGVPDVLIFGPPPLYPSSPGAAIELKRREGGTTSPEQREWLEHLENHGWCCAVCKGWEEAREFLAGLGWNEKSPSLLGGCG